MIFSLKTANIFMQNIRNVQNIRKTFTSQYWIESRLAYYIFLCKYNKQSPQQSNMPDMQVATSVQFSHGKSHALHTTCRRVRSKCVCVFPLSAHNLYIIKGDVVITLDCTIATLQYRLLLNDIIQKRCTRVHTKRMISIWNAAYGKRIRNKN